MYILGKGRGAGEYIARCTIGHLLLRRIWRPRASLKTPGLSHRRAELCPVIQAHTQSLYLGCRQNLGSACKSKWCTPNPVPQLSQYLLVGRLQRPGGVMIVNKNDGLAPVTCVFSKIFITTPEDIKISLSINQSALTFLECRGRMPSHALRRHSAGCTYYVATWLHIALHGQFCLDQREHRTPVK